MAKIIHIYRDYPEHGISEMDIQEQDLDKLLARGWRVKESPTKDKAPEPEKKKEAEDVKESEPVKPSKTK